MCKSPLEALATKARAKIQTGTEGQFCNMYSLSVLGPGPCFQSHAHCKPDKVLDAGAEPSVPTGSIVAIVSQVHLTEPLGLPGEDPPLDGAPWVALDTLSLVHKDNGESV